MKVTSIKHQDVIGLCLSIKEQVLKSGKKYVGIYPILRGGYYPAITLSKMLDIPLVYLPGVNVKEILIVDDLIDSGRTIKKYSAFDTAVLVDKSNIGGRATYIGCQYPTGEWVEFPWEDTVGDLQSIVVRQLEAIGEDPNRTGLLGTPERVVRMWNEIYRGYDKDQVPKFTSFPNGGDGIVYDQMVVDNGDFYSQCEHHLVPFFGKYWFAYIPAKTGLIVGLSKIARVVDYYSAKLQIQERLVSDVVTHIENALIKEGYAKPLGIAMVMKGEHLCKTMRGAKKKGTMTTSFMTGVFKSEQTAKDEFMNFVNNG